MDVENTSVERILHLKVRTYQVKPLICDCMCIRMVNNNYMHLFNTHLSPPWNREELRRLDGKLSKLLL